MIASADSQVIHKRFTGDSENDLKINIFLAAVESAVDADADMVFKDPAQVCYTTSPVKAKYFKGEVYVAIRHLHYSQTNNFFS